MRVGGVDDWKSHSDCSRIQEPEPQRRTGNTHEWSILMRLRCCWFNTRSSLCIASAVIPMRRIHSGLELLWQDCILPRYVKSSTALTVWPFTFTSVASGWEPKFWTYTIHYILSSWPWPSTLHCTSLFSVLVVGVCVVLCDVSTHYHQVWPPVHQLWHIVCLSFVGPPLHLWSFDDKVTLRVTLAIHNLCIRFKDF